MNRQEQHWEQLFGKLTNEGTPWCGIWKVYSPEKEVIKSSQGIRNLRANADRTVITHTNQFLLPDGSKIEKQWEIEKKDCNLPDGLLHPADPTKRSFALLDYGASTWTPQTLKSGENFSIELFLKDENWNTSVGLIYDQNGYLEKFLHLREQMGSFPDVPEKPEVKNLSGKWSGKKQSIGPDLELSPVEEINELVLDPTEGKNETFNLPDGIVINCPKKIQLGEEFELVAGKLMAENQYKRLRAKYDRTGAFSILISEVFQREA